MKNTVFNNDQLVGNKKPYILLFILLIIAIIFSVRHYKSIKLQNNYLKTEGRFVRSNYNLPHEFKYKFKEHKTKYLPILNIPFPSCKKYLRNKMIDLEKFSFPVVYEKGNPKNSEILIFNSQYKKYNIEIPEPLKDVVNKNSEFCGK